MTKDDIIRIGRAAGCIEPRPGRQRRPAVGGRASNSTHSREPAQDQTAWAAQEVGAFTAVDPQDIVGEGIGCQSIAYANHSEISTPNQGLAISFSQRLRNAWG